MIADLCDGQPSSRVDDIRTLNDAFRRSFVGGRVVLTAGLAALPQEIVAQVLTSVKAFDGFDADNDPYNEHDFGSLSVRDERFFWKIDTFDRSLSRHSPDAGDSTVTTRVLTIMLAEEY